MPYRPRHHELRGRRGPRLLSASETSARCAVQLYAITFALSGAAGRSPDLRVWVDDGSMPDLDSETELALSVRDRPGRWEWRALFTAAKHSGSAVMLRTALAAEIGMRWEITVEAVDTRRTVVCDADVVSAPKEWTMRTYLR